MWGVGARVGGLNTGFLDAGVSLFGVFVAKHPQQANVLDEKKQFRCFIPVENRYLHIFHLIITFFYPTSET